MGRLSEHDYRNMISIRGGHITSTLLIRDRVEADHLWARLIHIPSHAKNGPRTWTAFQLCRSQKSSKTK